MNMGEKIIKDPTLCDFKIRKKKMPFITDACNRFNIKMIEC